MFGLHICLECPGTLERLASVELDRCVQDLLSSIELETVWALFSIATVDSQLDR